MTDPHQRPALVLLTSHWIGMLGTGLVTLAVFSWLFVLPMHIRGYADNPYIGLLVFIAIPILFFAGWILIAIGIARAKRQVSETFSSVEYRRSGWRRAGLFFGIMTVANIVIGSQLTYSAVEHMEKVQFCGQSCHVMKPEFSAHQASAHQRVACAACHIAPGATGWIRAKMAGTRQLRDVMFKTYPRPIESAIESNRLVSSADTCEQCHAREKFIGPRVRILTRYKDDESNTRTETVLTMLIGGGRFGGIHGAHIGPGVHIRFAAADKKRQTIPWVSYRNSESGVTRTYVASDAKEDAIRSMPIFQMQCSDCHNRAAHAFPSPEHAVDDALATGRIPVGLPFIKKTGVELIKGDYKSDDEAGQKIPAGLEAFYRQKYSGIYAQRAADIQAAGQSLLAVYRQNVFSDLKVTWGTYPNNLGHTDYPGCFRCHDDGHAAADKKTIPQDCSMCHQAVAMEEASPEILKTLGMAGQVVFQKH